MRVDTCSFPTVLNKQTIVAAFRLQRGGDAARSGPVLPEKPAARTPTRAEICDARWVVQRLLARPWLAASPNC